MRRDERAFATLETIFGLFWIVLIAAGGFIASSWPAEINAAHAAAYEAARAAVEAPTAEEGEATGRARAQEVMRNHGYDTPVDVTFSAAGRGEALTARVHVELPALRFPGVGQWDAIGFTKSNTQTVPAYRSYG